MRFTFHLYVLLLLWILLAWSTCRGAELNGGLDDDVNPPIDDQLDDTELASLALRPLETYTSLHDWFTPVVGYTHDGAERARSHLVSPSSRFLLFPQAGSPGGAIAYSTVLFQHPRTGQWKRAVMMLSLTPGLRGEFIGEAHFPEGSSSLVTWQTWQRLNQDAKWDRRSILKQFGSLALHL